MNFQQLFHDKPMIGMIHMPALPGAPGNTMSMRELTEYALSESDKLETAGLDAVIVENVGDVPLLKYDLPPYTVAAMTSLVKEVVGHTKLKVGVNVLRNACEEAYSVAHIAGAHFIRCNILIGAYATDQGIIEGCGAKVVRLKKALGSEVLIFADVHSKHAYPIFNVEIEYAAQDLAERGGADAVIVSGARSPIPPSFERVKKVKDAIEKPVLIGSGLGLANIKQFYERSDGLIIGEPDFKIKGVWGGPSDERAYAKAVKLCHR
ncbi:MAG TPA: BtpA/SgcQ family protein [Nitrososphaerales archaeon]|nr:BtpA/SgcQ family protein [Nitrososphaerales archaeon]